MRIHGVRTNRKLGYGYRASESRDSQRMTVVSVESVRLDVGKSVRAYPLKLSVVLELPAAWAKLRAMTRVTP